MTDTVNVPRDVLERIASADFEGVFSYEENPQYESVNTKGHIIRYRPNEQPPAPDGSRSIKMSFPVLAVAAWLSGAEKVLPVFAELLTHAPALAKSMLAAAPKSEAVSGLPPIAFDGPHKPNDHRVWLARKLLDSKNDDATAYGIAAFHPAISDLWKKSKTFKAIRGQEVRDLYTDPAPASDELLEALEDLTSACEAEFCSVKTEGESFTYAEPDEADVSYPSSHITFGHIRRARAAIAKHKGPQS